MISLQGWADKRVNGVAPLQTLQALCLGGGCVCVCARVCVFLASPPRFLAGRIRTFLQGKDLKEGPSSTRFGSADCLTDTGHQVLLTDYYRPR